MWFSGSKYTYITVALVNTLNILVGCVISWSSPMLEKFKDPATSPINRSLSLNESSWISSLLAFGAMFGPLLVGFLADKIGRKPVAALIAVPFALSFLISAFSTTVVMFYVARILSGISLGGTFTLSSIYIVEVAQDSNRGLLASSSTSFIMAGCLFTYAVGPYTSMMVFNLVLGVISLLFIPAWLYFSPETPYYCIKRNKDEDAFKSLTYLTRNSEEQVRQKIEQIQVYLASLEKGSISKAFKVKSTRKAFLFGLIHTTFQQFDGIVVILMYNQEIFNKSGVTIKPEVCAIIVGAVQFLTCFNTPVLSEYFGRRKLLLFSTICDSLALVVLGAYFHFYNRNYDMSSVSWLPLLTLVVYIVAYQSGSGALPWVLMAELLPSNVISVASSITTANYWFFGFLLTKFFGSVSENVGLDVSYWFFAVFCLLWFLFTYVWCFETKGKSFAEIQQILSK